VYPTRAGSLNEYSSRTPVRSVGNYPDALHHDRFILIGHSREHRLPYVVHAEVRVDVIRIISARKATKHEKARYEND
jgi:uncharacterized DUF497 family protein